MDRRSGTSILWLVTVRTAIVIAGSMGVYALLEYLLGPSRSLASLALEHGWHVAAIGLLTYFSLYWVLFRQVIEPVKQIHRKLYAISSGDLTPMKMESNILEVQEITDGINQMIQRIEQTNPRLSIVDLSATAHILRSVAKGKTDIPEEEKERLLAVSRTLDQMVEEFTLKSILASSFNSPTPST